MSNSEQQEVLEKARYESLRQSQNLHKVFSNYLIGFITWEEFIEDCKAREVKFNERINMDTPTDR